MPITDVLVLGLILAVFAAFAGTLAWVSWHDGEPEKRPVQQPMLHSPFTARHA